MMRCGGLLPLLAYFIIALNKHANTSKTMQTALMQTDSSKQNHQQLVAYGTPPEILLYEWIQDNKENLIEVFSELFSEKEGEGECELILLVCFEIEILPRITKFYEKCFQGNKVRNGLKTIRKA